MSRHRERASDKLGGREEARHLLVAEWIEKFGGVTDCCWE